MRCFVGLWRLALPASQSNAAFRKDCLCFGEVWVSEAGIDIHCSQGIQLRLDGFPLKRERFGEAMAVVCDQFLTMDYFG